MHINPGTHLMAQVTSVADFSTNYCNLRNLYCGTDDGCVDVTSDLGVTETSVDYSFGASADPSACVVPSTKLLRGN